MNPRAGQESAGGALKGPQKSWLAALRALGTRQTSLRRQDPQPKDPRVSIQYDRRRHLYQEYRLRMGSS